MSTAPELRPYQADIVARVAGHRRPLIPLPTGGGKTVVAAAIINDKVRENKRVLFLAHRRELIQQAAAKLYNVGVDAGIIQAGYPLRPQQPVQIASVQTLHERAVRTSTMEMPAADVVFVDEAHHVRAKTYESILAEYPNAIVIGLTATPSRSDGRGLGKAFDTLIECPGVRELVDLGFLVPARAFAPSSPDLKGVRVRAGDYVGSQLEARMDTAELVGNIPEHWLRLNPKRKATIVFAAGVNHSVHIRNELCIAGILAAHIDGSTPTDERDAILRKLASGEIEAVSNCAVLTEGFDCPDVGCIVLACPTKSLARYLQMVGRGLRSAPGKADVIVLDHAGATFSHGLVEDPIVWTLEEDRRAENKTHASRGQHGEMPKMCTCPECLGVMFAGRPCPLCGWHSQPKPQDFETADGELCEVRRDRSVGGSTLDRARFHGMLLWIGRDKGYKPGWAGHKFKEKFGTWPADRYVMPIPPDKSVRAWVRSRQIAYAKAMEKAGAA